MRSVVNDNVEVYFEIYPTEALIDKREVFIASNMEVPLSAFQKRNKTWAQFEINKKTYQIPLVSVRKITKINGKIEKEEHI